MGLLHASTVWPAVRRGLTHVSVRFAPLGLALLTLLLVALTRSRAPRHVARRCRRAPPPHIAPLRSAQLHPRASLPELRAHHTCCTHDTTPRLHSQHTQGSDGKPSTETTSAYACDATPPALSTCGDSSVAVGLIQPRSRHQPCWWRQGAVPADARSLRRGCVAAALRLPSLPPPTSVAAAVIAIRAAVAAAAAECSSPVGPIWRCARCTRAPHGSAGGRYTRRGPATHEPRGHTRSAAL